MLSQAEPPLPPPIPPSPQSSFRVSGFCLELMQLHAPHLHLVRVADLVLNQLLQKLELCHNAIMQWAEPYLTIEQEITHY